MNASQIVGNIGLYHVCRELSRLGWNAMPTTRNARGADVIAHSAGDRRFLTIQVKTMTSIGNVPVGKGQLEHRARSVDWWIVVAHAETPTPVTYVLSPDDVIACATDYSGTLWLRNVKEKPDGPATFKAAAFLEAWHRLGTPKAAETVVEPAVELEGAEPPTA